MSGILGAVSPIFVSSLSGAVSVADPLSPLHWLHFWVPSTGLLAMGLGNLLGGGDDEEAGGSVEADDDFMDSGDFGGGAGEFDGGLDEEEDDPLDDIEPRIDDLEAELGDLASTVSTVHGEHESMRESVEEIEDNVRKLLEVYEIVTQGANPFADDVPETTDDGGFGLFAANDDSASETADESLFDDVDEAASTSASEAAVAAAPSAGDGDKSFEDLKSEFELDEGPAEEELIPDEAAVESDGGESPPSEEFEFDNEPADDSSASGAPAKPYLADLPGGYGAELLVMEWLDYLVSESSVADAIRAVRYYHTVDWITEDVAGHLQSVLSGASRAPGKLAATDGGRPAELSVDHHTRSLEYIAQLGGLDGGADHPPGPPGGLGQYRTGGEDRGVQR